MRRPQLRTLTPRQIVFDVALAAVYLPVFGLGTITPLFSRLVSEESFRALGFSVTTILAVALALRRLSPGLSLAIAWIGAVAQMGFGLDPQPFDIAILGVLYVTAAYGSRAVRWLGLTSAVLGAAVASGYMLLIVWLNQPASATGFDAFLNGGVWFLAFVFALLLSWTTGALTRASFAARENKRAQERAQFEAAGEQERGRIARDMHDVVAHSLAVVVAQADGARYAADADPWAAKDALATISQTARSALTDVRVLLAQLRHRQGDGPQPALADLEGLFAQVRGAGVALDIDVDPAPPGEPPAAVQLAVYRILQEALTNALRHGGGAVSVRMSWRADGVDLEVRNSLEPEAAGIGARPAKPTVHADHAAAPAKGATVPAAGTARGHGIIGMTERAQLAAGTLTAAPHGAMFIVRAYIPVTGYDSSASRGPNAGTSRATEGQQ